MCKKDIASGVVMVLAVSALPAAAGAKVPENLQFSEEVQIIPGVGETWDEGSTPEISGGG